jgi:hypothetical protein
MDNWEKAQRKNHPKLRERQDTAAHSSHAIDQPTSTGRNRPTIKTAEL